jgi:hypothetical protein
VSARNKSSRRGFPRRLFLFVRGFLHNVARMSEAISGVDFNARAFRIRSKVGRMSKLFRFPSATRRDPSVDAWFVSPDDELRRLARMWFEEMRRLSSSRGVPGYLVAPLIEAPVLQTMGSQGTRVRWLARHPFDG